MASPHRAARPLIVAGLLAGVAPTQVVARPAEIAQFLDDHCIGCHGGKAPEAGLDLGAVDARALPDALAVWLDARDRVRARVMPPAGYSEPHAEEVARFSAWVDALLDERAGDLPQERESVGPRRLSRAQYERAVADLFGVAVPASVEFPQDDLAFGFDTMADALSFSALHVEKYLAAAEAVAAAIVDDSDGVAAVGRLPARALPAGSRWWHDRDPGSGPARARLQAMLAPLTERAWRSPIGATDLAPLLHVAEAALARGDPWRTAVRLVLTAILASPRFLLRTEAAAAGPVVRAYELAARLSFFLWGSVPDDALLTRACDGSLGEPVALAAEVVRMLADARAGALATDFAAQWLELRHLASITFDGARYQGVTPALLRSMRRETELLFEAVLREHRPARELLTADFTFLDRALAQHYGVAGSFDDELRRVPVADPERRGLLGQASILALTSNPTRTSPVKRGKWILSNLLAAPPAAPPPGDDSFAAGAVVDTAAGLRAQMATHRRQESCATCHARMDGLGLALERFDAVGRRREHDGGLPIDDLGVLPGGAKVAGARGVQAYVSADPTFLRCLAQKLFLFGVGRAPLPAERVQLDAAVRALPVARATLADLIAEVVRSPAFVGR